MSVQWRSMKQVCNTNGLLFPERMAQNLLSLSQQTVHSSNVLCTNKHILGTRFSALKHSWPSQPGLSKIIQQPKTPRGGEMNLGLCVFKLLPTISSPAAFLHQTSLWLLLSLSSPPVIWKQIDKLASEQCFGDLNNLPLHSEGRLGLLLRWTLVSWHCVAQPTPCRLTQ